MIKNTSVSREKHKKKDVKYNVIIIILLNRVLMGSNNQ